MPAPIRLALRVQPGAKTSEIIGWTTDPGGQPVLKLRLRAPPVEGKANAALVEFLAEALRLRPRQITLQRGEKSREKIVLIDGATAEQIRALA